MFIKFLTQRNDFGLFTNIRKLIMFYNLIQIV